MPGIRVNLSETDSGGFDALPAGNYICKVTDGEIREAGPNAKHPGSEYIAFEYTIQVGEHEGRRVWQNASLLPNALFTIKQLLEATGKWSDAELSAEDFHFEIEDVLGADIKVRVTQREYEGEMRNDVKRVRALTAEDTAEASLLP